MTCILTTIFQISFGFAKFKDVKNSERCIRGFYSRGYEVGFARVSEILSCCRFSDIQLTYKKESFNARLKAEGDEGSTNLYISNLPKDINESVSPANRFTYPVYIRALLFSDANHDIDLEPDL